MTTVLAKIATVALALGCAAPRAEAGEPRPIARLSEVDEAVGQPGADPYAFYVFNRDSVRAERPAPLPPMVCACFDAVQAPGRADANDSVRFTAR